jgi:hypothetical protein
MAHRNACVRCGRNQPRERLIFSKFTKSYYCQDFKACDRRAVRRAAKQLDSPTSITPRAAFEGMEPYRALAERMARAEWGDALPGPHGGQGKGIHGANLCRRCGEPYDGVTAHGPGHCARVDMTIPDALLAADVGLRVVRTEGGNRA